MCGIIYAKNIKDNAPINNTIKTLYLAQKSRGYQGFGFVGLTKDKLQLFKSEQESQIFDFLDNNPFDEILYHHRFPTSTANTTKTAHPFQITYNDKVFYFVHNGIISNALALKAEHYTLSLPYASYDKKIGTFNDSEALAYSFVLSLNGIKTVDPIGSASFICLQTDKKTDNAERLYYYTNGGSPLKCYRDKNLFMLSSEVGQFDIKPHKLYYYEYATKKIKKQKTSFTVKSYQYTNNWNWYDNDDKYFGTSTTLPDTMDTLDNEYNNLVDEVDTIQLEVDNLETKLYHATLNNAPAIELRELEDLIDDRQGDLQELYKQIDDIHIQY